MTNNFIWVFGENLAKTASCNSFHLWKYSVNVEDNIEKYFILEKNENTSKIYSSLSRHEKKFIVWKNSLKHFSLYNNADLFFVNYSSKDVAPDKLIFKKMSMRLKKPFIHLQRGVCGIKKPPEKGHYYGNNIVRYLNYNPTMTENLIKYNKFKDYQLYYAKYQPRYGDLFRKIDQTEETNQILWFLSYRNYIEKDPFNLNYIALFIKRIATDNILRNYLIENKLKLKICTHFHFKDELKEMINQYNDDLIDIVDQKEIDTNLEIAKSRLLITDYSSIVYDFSLIGRPYIIFQPDLNIVNRKKDMSKSSRELDDYTITRPDRLIEKILSGNYETHEYIERAKTNKDDFDFAKQDKHLEEFYNYFKEFQLNKITFLGYNFYGIGGTVNATMALAEALLQKGYFVNVLSLKRLSKVKHDPPKGLNMQYLSWDKSGSIKDKIRGKIYKSNKYYRYLELDFVKEFLPPFVGRDLTELMKNIKTNTLVSTRETLHLFLQECSSEHVKNKVFFFHTHADAVEELFPGVISKINEKRVDKAVFITERNRIALKEKLNYTNYNDYVNIGNTLVESKILGREQITPVEKKDKYSAIYLLRISKERKNDLDNLINFANYLKENNLNHVEIDVYGDGNYVNEFIKLINKNELNDIVHYKTATKKPIKKIRNHDLMIDFSYDHSFGMIYIEAILNGKKVYCMENPGSLEVMDNIPNSYIESYEWLSNQIKHLDEITDNELKENYDKINEKYSQNTIAEKFIDIID